MRKNNDSSYAIDSMRPEEKHSNISFNFAILAGFLLPHTNFFFLVVHVFLPLFLFITTAKRSSRSKSTLFAFSYIIFVFAFNVFYGTVIIIPKDLFRLIQFSFFFILFPFVGKVKLYSSTLHIILFFLLLSQLAFVFNIQALTDPLIKVYFNDGDINGISLERYETAANDFSSILQMRYGGIYGNPNQFCRQLTLLYIVYLIEYKSSNTSRLLFISLIVFFSVLLTGSRTGLIAVVLVVIIFSVRERKKRNRNRGFMLNIAVVLLITIMLIGTFHQTLTMGFRGFEIEAGLGNSLLSKIGFFNTFVTKSSFLNLLFGHLSSSSFERLYGVKYIDSEWGELFASFGAIGTLIAILILVRIFRYKSKDLNFYLLNLLWGITSTILFSFRMSFLFLLFLSKYISDTNHRINN